MLKLQHTSYGLRQAEQRKRLSLTTFPLCGTSRFVCLKGVIAGAAKGENVKKEEMRGFMTSLCSSVAPQRRRRSR